MDYIERRRYLAREREKKRVKQDCIKCLKNKICRYAGPLCQGCYGKYKNPSIYKKILASNKKYSKTPAGMFCKIKTQAKYRNKEFLLSKEFYKDLTKKPCNYCNSPFDGGIWADRIDNSQGYTEDNVLPCCGACNHIRNSYLTVEEMEVAMKAVIEYRNKIKER